MSVHGCVVTQLGFPFFDAYTPCENAIIAPSLQTNKTCLYKEGSFMAFFRTYMPRNERLNLRLQFHQCCGQMKDTRAPSPSCAV